MDCHNKVDYSQAQQVTSVEIPSGPGPDNTKDATKVYNIGNPVFTFATDVSPYIEHEMTTENCSEGYLCDPINIMYRTTSREYGSRAPTVCTVPSTFCPKSNKFSDHLGKCGMPRNRSLNCGLDKSNVPDH